MMFAVPKSILKEAMHFDKRVVNDSTVYDGMVFYAVSTIHLVTKCKSGDDEKKALELR